MKYNNQNGLLESNNVLMKRSPEPVSSPEGLLFIQVQSGGSDGGGVSCCFKLSALIAHLHQDSRWSLKSRSAFFTQLT